LGQVGGVRVLQTLFARIAVNEGCVQIDELPPGGLIARITQAHKQTSTRGWNLGHCSSRPCDSPSSTRLTRKPFSPPRLFTWGRARNSSAAVVFLILHCQFELEVPIHLVRPLRTVFSPVVVTLDWALRSGDIEARADNRQQQTHLLAVTKKDALHVAYPAATH